MEPFKIPNNHVSAEQVVKSSRFICNLGHADSVESAGNQIRNIRQQHPRANHTCWAFIAGSPNSDNRGMSDDGEPRGTAGKPMLAILDYSGFGEVWTTVTRYFGGIKLGTGGLVRAYSNSVQQALQLSETVIKESMTTEYITTDYNLLAAIQKMLNEERAKIVSQDFQDTVRLTIQIPTKRLHLVKKRLTDISMGTITLKKG